jgi:hypothetical protein
MLRYAEICQIGGMSGLQNLMKSMNGMDPSALMGMMPE